MKANKPNTSTVPSTKILVRVEQVLGGGESTVFYKTISESFEKVKRYLSPKTLRRPFPIKESIAETEDGNARDNPVGR
jgi:hypothetical protein